LTLDKECKGDCETVIKELETNLICHYCKNKLKSKVFVTEKEMRMTEELRCDHCKRAWYNEID